jgi:hypothetical protein
MIFHHGDKENTEESKQMKSPSFSVTSVCSVVN